MIPKDLSFLRKLMFRQIRCLIKKKACVVKEIRLTGLGRECESTALRNENTAADEYARCFSTSSNI